MIGEIQEDATVKGGTGWGAEFAKICNKPLYTFDQKQNSWFRWNEQKWEAESQPRIRQPHFAGLGTRYLQDNGKDAIAGLIQASLR